MKPEFKPETEETSSPKRLKMKVLDGGAFLYTKEEIDSEEMKEDPESKRTFLDVTALDLVVDDLKGFGRRIVQIFSRSSKKE